MRQGPVEEFALHVGEFFLLWMAHHEPGEMPTLLEIEPVGRSRTARREYAAAASEALTERGLGTIDEPVDDVRDLLHTLAHAEIRFEFTTRTADVTTSIAGAVHGARAVMAMRSDTALQLRRQEVAGLVETMAGLLPQERAGEGPSANVTMDDFTRACDAGADKGTWGFGDVLRRSGVHPSTIPTIMNAVGDRHGGGTLSVMRRVGAGRWQRAPLRLTWVDTASGRYSLRQDAEWATITPATSARMATLVADVFNQVIGSQSEGPFTF
ncbi:MAG: ESX secretion-associated protein EspG [Actinophytocola sp.]|uniref:ESX secretion-associated protein EspG n=1 Tax=Actinophytocola sp. TaxID=1872138 RepID=UPI003C707FC5